MASRSFKTKYGKAVLFKNNPRVIRTGQFNALCESIEKHPEFMTAQKIVLWQVPEKLDVGEGEKCPFEGQEGDLIILSGNQRAKSIKAGGNDSIPDEWCCEAKTADGQWWAWRDAEIFLNLANSPAGVSGDFAYDVLQEKFDQFRMACAGIDFSNFTQAISEGTMEDELEKETVEKVENDDVHGEKNEELENFISEREKTRKSLKYIDESGFHLLIVFPDGFAQKAEFLSQAGMFGGKPVEVNKDPWIDLVFESVDQKNEFVHAAGLDAEDPETGVPATLYGLFCDGRRLAQKMGIALKETGLKFRDRIVDKQLAEMTMEPMEQKTEKEIENEIYEKLKAERRALGMSTRSAGERVSSDDGEEGEE